MPKDKRGGSALNYWLIGYNAAKQALAALTDEQMADDVITRPSSAALALSVFSAELYSRGWLSYVREQRAAIDKKKTNDEAAKS